MSGGPICFTSQCPIGVLHELETRPWSNSNRCSQSAMDRSEGVCVSPLLTDRQVSIKNPAREGPGIDFDSTSLANPAMVSSTEGVSVPESDSSPPPPKPSAECVGRTPSQGYLTLATWPVSGLTSRTREFQSRHQPSFLLHGGKTLKLHTPVAGGNGSSGAHTMDLNLFVHL